MSSSCSMHVHSQGGVNGMGRFHCLLLRIILIGKFGGHFAIWSNIAFVMKQSNKDDEMFHPQAKIAFHLVSMDA